MVVVPNFVLYVRPFVSYTGPNTDVASRRFARVENGECIIGMQRPAMIPLIVFDLLVNVCCHTGPDISFADNLDLPHHYLFETSLWFVLLFSICDF